MPGATRTSDPIPGASRPPREPPRRLPPSASPASLRPAIFPRGGGRIPESGLVQTSLASPPAPCSCCPTSAQRGGWGGRGEKEARSGAEPLVTRPERCTARGGEDPPGEGGPGRRNSGDPGARSGSGLAAARGGGGAVPVASPSPLPAAGPAPRQQHGGGRAGGREGAGAQVGVGLAAYLYLRGEPGGVGGPGRGGKGQGRGRGKGEPLCGVASEPLPPPPRPPPPFRFTQTNKMAAVTARLFRPPKSSVQIGRMFTVKNALVRLRGPPAPQTGRRRRADHFLVSGPPACWPRSMRKGS